MILLGFDTTIKTGTQLRWLWRSSICALAPVADDTDVAPQDELAKSQIGARLARLLESGHRSAPERYSWTSLLVVDLMVSLEVFPVVSNKTVLNHGRSQCFLSTPTCYMPVVYFLLDELTESRLQI